MIARLGRAALVALLLGSMGCNGPSSSVDAGGSSETDGGGPSSAPMRPAPPVLTPCRAGWREVVEEGITLCDPWPEGGRRDDCGPDEAHFPGTDGCARIGTACPADGWPADLPTDRNIVYVSASAAPGGDGRTRETAFDRIVAAADAAPFGSLIAIAAGSYDEGEIYVGPNIALWGACVAETIVGSSSVDRAHGVIFLADNGSEARNLRVESPERLGIVVAGTPSTITDVVVSGARHIGIAGFAGTATLDHVVIRDMREGRAIEIQRTWSATLRSVHVDGSFYVGVAVQGTGTLDAENLFVTGVRADPGTSFSAAIGADGATQATLSGVVLEDNGECAVYVDTGATLTASDVVVRDHTEPSSQVAFLAANGATVQASRVLVRNQRGGAFEAQGGASFTLADVVALDVLEYSSFGHGRGIDATSGGSVTADRVLIVRAHDGGLVATGAGSTMDARDVHVRELVGRATGVFGRGVVAHDEAVITLERLLVERARDIAVLATGDGVITAHAVTVLDVLGAPAAGDYGIGVWAENRGRMTLTDVLIERARLAGAGAIEAGELSLTRATVRETLPAACAETTCADRPGGFAIAAPYGGVVTVDDFEIDGVELCGVVVGDSTLMSGPASVDLHRGSITGAPIGACVQAPGYDVARLRDDVEYRDVGIPLQSTTYALPGALPAM